MKLAVLAPIGGRIITVATTLESSRLGPGPGARSAASVRSRRWSRCPMRTCRKPFFPLLLATVLSGWAPSLQAAPADSLPDTTRIPPPPTPSALPYVHLIGTEPPRPCAGQPTSLVLAGAF